MNSGIRLLHLPNENAEDRSQVGPRSAFWHLQEQGRISQLATIPFPSRERTVGAVEAAREILERAKQLRPDIIFWQHVGRFPVDTEFISKLRSNAPEALLVYHEGDVFSRSIKRYSASEKLLVRSADLVFQVGLGSMQRLNESIGAKQVRWVPSAFDKARFAVEPPPVDVCRLYDAVMIGNLVRRIARLWELPGASQRAAIVKRLSRILGERFAVFGRGWGNSPNAKGPVAYAEQQIVTQRSWVSVSWNHFDDSSYFFSDRLPIALAAGVPHVCNYHSGYDTIFRECKGVIFAGSVQEVVDGVIYLLSRPREERLALGQRCRAFSFQNFEADAVYTRVFECCVEQLRTVRATGIGINA